MSAGCKFCGDEHCMCEACKSMRGLLQELQTTASNGTGTRAEQMLEEMKQMLEKAGNSKENGSALKGIE